MKKKKVVPQGKYIVADEKYDEMDRKKMASNKKPMDIADALAKAKKAVKKKPAVKPSTKKNPGS